MEEKGKEKVELEEFMYWLQLTMAKKQKQSLSGVTERFESIFLILRSLLNTTIKLNQIVLEESEKIGSAKSIIDNIFHILQFTMAMQERITQLSAHFHALAHVTSQHHQKEWKQFLKELNNAICELPTYLREMNNRLELTYPLLKKIYNSLQIHRVSIQKTLECVKKLELRKSVRNREDLLKKFGQLQFNHSAKIVKHVDQVCKIIAETEYKLEKMIEPHSKMAQIIKYKSQLKKIFNDDLKLEIQNKIMKYAEIIGKENFRIKELTGVKIEEFCEVLQHMEEQTSLKSALKEMIMFQDEYNDIMIEPTELFQLYNIWKQCLNHLKIALTPATYPNPHTKDVEHFVNALTFFANEIQSYYYLMLAKDTAKNMFTKLRFKIQLFCVKEFNKEIDLHCKYIK